MPVAEAWFIGNLTLLQPGDTPLITESLWDIRDESLEAGGLPGAVGGGRADACLSLGELCPLSWARFPHL